MAYGKDVEELLKTGDTSVEQTVAEEPKKKRAKKPEVESE